MRELYRGYVDRMSEIRRLSSPALNEIEDADGYRERLRDNFIRIGELARENREFLDSCLYPVIESENRLDKDAVSEIEEFGEELISPMTGEVLDLPVMYLMSEKLINDSMDKGDHDGLIRQADQQISVYYELMNMTKRIRAYPEISDHYRNKGFELGKFFLMLLDKNRFLYESPENMEIILTDVRYSVVFYEGIQGDPESNKKQLELLDKLLEIIDDPFYKNAVPDFDWDYARFRTLNYYAMTTESFNACGYSDEQLRKIYERSKELCDFWDDNKAKFEEMLEGMDDRRFIQAMYIRNACLTGHMSLSEYRKLLLDIYRMRDARDYSAAAIYLNLSIPQEFICLLDKDSLTSEEKAILKAIYENMTSYAFHMPNGETLSMMLEFYVDIIDNFIEVAGGVTFEDMVMQCLVAFHPPTYVHSVMVGQITECLCEHLIRLKPELFINVLGCRTGNEVWERRYEILNFAYHAALCHDFGKISIIDTVFVYGRRLLDMEFDLIKTHPRTGYDMMLRYASTKRYADVAVSHHKWYDNSKGYPTDFDSSKSQFKPIIDLVLCADCLDAATDTVGRSYNKGKELSAFIAELREGAGNHYAPWLPDLLSDNRAAADVEYLLKNGRQQNYRNVYYLLRNMQERNV